MRFRGGRLVLDDDLANHVGQALPGLTMQHMPMLRQTTIVARGVNQTGYATT